MLTIQMKNNDLITVIELCFLSRPFSTDDDWKQYVVYLIQRKKRDSPVVES